MLLFAVTSNLDISRTSVMLYVRGFYSHTVVGLTKQRGSSGALPSTLLSCDCTLVLTPTGVCPKVLPGSPIVWVTSHWQTVDHKPRPSICISGCLSALPVQHNKSRHVPTRHQQPDWVYEPAPRPEGEEQRIREGGNPEKTQHDSACFSRLAYTAFILTIKHMAKLN